jgi:hypothetical protein
MSWWVRQRKAPTGKMLNELFTYRLYIQVYDFTKVVVSPSMDVIDDILLQRLTRRQGTVF